ncbi:hypothetical protein Tco_0157121 [Tanacetum coccineum]
MAEIGFFIVILLGFPGPSDGLRLHPIVFFSSGSGLTADSSVLTLTLAFLDFGLDFAQSFPFHAQVLPLLVPQGYKEYCKVGPCGVKGLGTWQFKSPRVISGVAPKIRDLASLVPKLVFLDFLASGLSGLTWVDFLRLGLCLDCVFSLLFSRIDKLADQLSTLVEIVSKKVVTPALVKAVEEICVTCSGPHAWYNCPNTDNNQSSVCAATSSFNQVNPSNRVSNQMAPPGFALVQNNGQNRYNQNQGFQNQPFQVPNNHVQQKFSNEFSSYKRTNDQMMRNMQNQINSLKGEFKNEIQNTMKTQQAILMNQQNVFQTNLQNMLSGFFQNQASTSGSLPSNTIPNSKGEMKAITTRSGVVYEGPSIPTNHSPKKVVERETKETTDKEQTNFQGSTAHIPPPVNPIPILEPDVPKTLPKPNISYPLRLDNQKLREKASYQKEKMFQDLRFDISFTDALLLMPRFAAMIRNLLMNKEKLLELAKIPLNENCSAMLDT